MAKNETWPRNPRSLWTVLRFFLVAGFLVQLISGALGSYEIWTGILGPEDFENPEVPLIGLATLASVGLWIFVFLMCVISTARLTFRMGKNLNTLEAPGERMPPGWAVGWYFVPLANLLMPFRGLKQIWRDTFAIADRSQPDDLVATLWWASWVFSNILGTWSFRATLESGGNNEAGPTNPELYMMSLYLGLASSILGAFSCVFMLKTFGPIVQAQDEIIRARAGASSA
ncbi:MAG TPA: hypothetical protein DHW63_08445 [Hyphomonadaceae bacterium]|nr:hypothetical protein [Hyphomonadaceae bacterium]